MIVILVVVIGHVLPDSVIGLVTISINSIIPSKSMRHWSSINSVISTEINDAYSEVEDQQGLGSLSSYLLSNGKSISC